MSCNSVSFTLRCCRRAFDVGVGDCDLGEDLVGGRGSGEGHGIGVPVGETERVLFDVRELS